MTNKTVRNFPKALMAFVIAASFVSESLAGEFTVERGKRYRATLYLKTVQRLADNELIARKFRALGFSSLECVFQEREPHVGSKASGQARIPARPCRLRSLRSLNCDNVSR
jgi:hypothetical protein